MPNFFPDIVYDILFWMTALVVALIFFLIGNYSSGRKDRVGRLIRESNERTKQIRELEKINAEFESKNRELFAKELELTLANRKLRTLEEAKSKFISVTTHQLRTPLSAIKWTFDMAAKGQLGENEEEKHKIFAQGLAGTERVISIVNDLLKVDMIDSEQSAYDFRPVSVVELVESVVMEFEARTKGKDLEIILTKPQNSVPYIEIDADKIRMALENLIDNAIKYNFPKGKVMIDISDTRLNSADASLEISVSDTGIGIPRGEEDKMFQKFFRATNAIKQEPDGSGLGLYIARDIVEHHGGAMWFERPASGGTEFHFTLPLHRKKV